MLLLDAAHQASPQTISELVHAIWTMIALFIAMKLHQVTGGK